MAPAYLLEKSEESDVSLSLFGRSEKTSGNIADPINLRIVKILSNIWGAV